MGLACRLMLVDQTDRIHRLGIVKFAEVLKSPGGHRYRALAGQRVRMAYAFVQLVDRRPTRVVRMTFHILRFDRTGCLDAETFRRQQMSRFEAWVAAGIPARASDAGAEDGIVDAGSRFTARGGVWAPSKSLERTLSEAALGRLKCPRL